MKKAGPNKGRWFYTCQRPRDVQCRFFLFEDQAQAREKEALLRPGPILDDVVGGGSSQQGTPRSELASTAVTEPIFSQSSSVFALPPRRQRIFRGVPRSPDDTPRCDDVVGEYDSDAATDCDAASQATMARTSPGHRAPRRAAAPPKRKHLAAENGDEGAGSGRRREETGALDERNADEVMLGTSDRGQPRQSHQLHKSERSRPNDEPKTPGERAMRASFSDSLQGPASSKTRASATSEPAAKRFKTAGGAAITTLTPSRAGSAALEAGSASQDGLEADAEVTVAVLGLLRGEQVQAHVRRAVRETLNLHALKVRGLERARDLLREAVKSRDRKIAELQARVVKLENERLAERERLKKAASDLQALFQGGDSD